MLSRELTGKPIGVRAGVRLLTMASSSAKRRILRQLLERPLEWAPGKQARITPAGEGLLFVSFVAERWLQAAPHGPVDFDSGEAERAISSLVDGWAYSLVHTLARQPMSLQQLDAALPWLGEPAIRRRLTAMRYARLVEVRPAGAEEDGLYAPTDWLRAGIAPLSAAARLERRDPKPGMVPIEALDVEAAFLLTLPLLELPDGVAGPCRLGVEIGEEGAPEGLAGVTARVEDGRVTACETRLDDSTGTWAIASAGDWLDTLIEPDAKRVRTGGDRVLAASLLAQLRKTLFGLAVTGAG